MAHVSQVKKDNVAQFVALVKKYPIVGVVNMEGMPTRQVQIMRATLRSNNVGLHMTKKRLLKLVFKESAKDKPGLDKLADKLPGMPALILAHENPFKLYKQLQKSKSPAPAKAGQTAPKDIVVPAGPTGFAPGPIIGELGSIGIKSGIEGGKVAIKQDSVVVKEGQVVSAKVAGILTRLGITPMEIGLDLINVYEAGSIFGKEVLAIDEDTYISNIVQAHQMAFNLAVEAGVMNSATTEFLITKAAKQARSLAIESAILASDVVDDVVARANAQATALQKIIDNQ
jgi:large subunit ribosomal protein L10